MQRPTARQLSYLRTLALQCGQTFTTPKTRHEASSEIQRLRATAPSSGSETRADVSAVRRDLAERPQDAAQVTREEITGYGSGARWAKCR